MNRVRGVPLEFCSQRSFEVVTDASTSEAHAPSAKLVCLFAGFVIASTGLLGADADDYGKYSAPSFPVAKVQGDICVDRHDFLSIDLKAEKIKQIIQEIGSYLDNWNGYGAKRFSAKQLQVFLETITGLDSQPDVMPTARNSLLMQFVFPGGNLLMFELFSDCMEEVLVPAGDYSRAESKSFESNFSQKINDELRIMRGL